MPTAGDTVTYTLTQGDVDTITAQRADDDRAREAADLPPATRTPVTAGQACTATVSRVLADGSVDLLVQLDETGTDTYWALARVWDAAAAAWVSKPDDVPPPPPLIL